MIVSGFRLIFVIYCKPLFFLVGPLSLPLWGGRLWTLSSCFLLSFVVCWCYVKTEWTAE